MKTEITIRTAWLVGGLVGWCMGETVQSCNETCTHSMARGSAWLSISRGLLRQTTTRGLHSVGGGLYPLPVN